MHCCWPAIRLSSTGGSLWGFAGLSRSSAEPQGPCPCCQGLHALPGFSQRLPLMLCAPKNGLKKQQPQQSRFRLARRRTLAPTHTRHDTPLLPNADTEALELTNTCAAIHPSLHPSIHPPIQCIMHTCMRAYMHSRLHACLHACTQAYMHTYIHTYIHGPYVRSYGCLPPYLPTYLPTYIHTCIDRHSIYVGTDVRDIAYTHPCLHGYVCTCMCMLTSA